MIATIFVVFICVVSIAGAVIAANAEKLDRWSHNRQHDKAERKRKAAADAKRPKIYLKPPGLNSEDLDWLWTFRGPMMAEQLAGDIMAITGVTVTVTASPARGFLTMTLYGSWPEAHRQITSTEHQIPGWPSVQFGARTDGVVDVHVPEWRY